MSVDRESVVLALTALATDRTPARIARTLAAGGRAALASAFGRLDPKDRESVLSTADRLCSDGIGAVLYGDPCFPARLFTGAGRPTAPLIFVRGNLNLLRSPGVGICGSREVSQRGLEAAAMSAQAAVQVGAVVISGNARGVDTAAHQRALSEGGSTIYVLPTGFDHTHHELGKRQPDRTLALSQFAPGQPWANYTAMERNKVIVRLAHALIVVEAGERGGSLAAGQEALKQGRPVMVCDLGDATPTGSIALEAGGARRVPADQLRGALAGLSASRTEIDQQGLLF